MTLTRMTAMIIANNPDLIFAPSAEANEEGKYIGWITMGEDDYCRPLLNTEAIFDTPDDAVAHMYDLRDQCIEFLKSDNE